jgi:hypothetical protein
MTRLEELEGYVSAQDWITDAHAVELGILRLMAARIDEGIDTPAMLAQYGLWFRDLKKSEPAEQISADPLEALLRR